jgi:large subunit ribosomal protein L24
MKIKKNDIVKIIQGKDNGKSGKVLRSLPKENKVVVE